MPRTLQAWPSAPANGREKRAVETMLPIVTGMIRAPVT